MRRAPSLKNLFGSRQSARRVTARRQKARRHQQPRRRPSGLAFGESLEGRAMMAFAPLPAAGNMLGNPILLSSDATGPNELTVILDDVTNSALGFVTATITTNDGQTGQYFNFSGISYSASNDTDGSVRNAVKLWTSYEADLLGLETAPADDAEVGLSTTWIVDSHFGPGAAVPVSMVMLNADALTVTSGVIGGNASTIAGEFESPTLPPDLNDATGAQITLISGTGVTGDDIDGTTDLEPVVAYTLTLQSQTAGVTLGTDVFTVGDLTINAAGTITLNGLLESTSGDIAAETTSGQILLNGAEVHALGGSVTLRALKENIVQVAATAPNPRWQDYIVADTDVTIVAGGEVVLIGDVRSNTGNISLSSTDREVDLSATGSLLHAVTGSVSATASAGSVAINQAQAGGDISLQAGHGTATVRDLLANNDVSVIGLSDVLLFGRVHSKTGDIVATSLNGGVNVAAVVRAEGGSVILRSNLSVTALGGGIDRIEVLSGGAYYDFAIVTVAPPVSGNGRAALARANIDSATGRITSIDVIDPGYGYALNEQVEVTIVGDETRTVTFLDYGPPVVKVTFENPGGQGAFAKAIATLTVPAITALSGVSVLAGSDVNLGVDVSTADGGVDLFSDHGQVATGIIAASVSGVSLVASSGNISIQQVTARDAIAVTAALDVTLSGSVQSTSGNVAIRSSSSNVSLSDSRAVISAGGSVALTSDTGSVSTPKVIVAQGDVAVVSLGNLALNNSVVSNSGNISIKSSGGAIVHNADVKALGGGIAIEAGSSIQSNTGGITSVTIVSGGGGYSSRTQVTIAPPAAGGNRAYARPVIVNGVITGIVLVDPGNGYSPGERPEVTITDVAPVVQPDPPIVPGSGAVAFAEAGVPTQGLYARDGIAVASGEDLLLFGLTTSLQGDIEVASLAGQVDLGGGGTALQALGGKVAIRADAGSLSVNNIQGSGGVSLVAEEGVSVGGAVGSGNGGITVTSKSSSVDVRQLHAKGDIGLIAFDTSSLSGEIASQQGDITFTVSSGGIFAGANVRAEAGSIVFSPQTFLQQQDGSGIEVIRVLAEGAVANAFPNVTVVVAPPASPGGEQATAEAVIGQRVVGDGGVNQGIEYYLSSVRITNPGRGYALGEDPIVTIGGLQGATAVGVGPRNVHELWAQQDISIRAGEDVALLYSVTAARGEISVVTARGSVDASGTNCRIHAMAGSAAIQASAGAVSVNQVQSSGDTTLDAHGSVIAATSISVGGKVAVTSAIGNISISGQVYAKTGDIDVASKSGSVSLAANMHADDAAISVAAHGGIFQRAGSGVQRIAVLYGGESAGNTPPVVTIGVAPPKGGGIAAQAFATLRSFTNAIGQTRYTIDEILITNPGRGYEIGESPEVAIDGIDGAAAIAEGPEGYQDIVAAKDILIAGGETVVLTNPLRSEAGNITISSTDGTLSLGAQDQLLNATGGAVSLSADDGRIEVNRIYAFSGVSVRGNALVSLVREVVSETSDIVAASAAGSVLVGANLLAKDGAVRLTANHQIRQTSQSGISGIEVLTGGQFVGGQNAPTVSVTIAPPAGGGVPAEAVAIAVVSGFTRELNPRPIWSVQSVLVTNPGSGYAIGERPVVTISGIPGALAVATGPAGMQSLIAEDDLVVIAGDDILLVDTARSNVGDVLVSSVTGSIDLGSPGQMLHAVSGAIAVTAESGGIDIHRAYAATGIAVRGSRSVSLDNEVVSATGKIVATSISGSLFITANVHASSGEVSLSAHQSLVQTRNTGVTDVEIVSPGSLASLTAPTVTVTIAAPAGGGRQAVAQAIVDPIGANAAGTTIWGVTSIVITDSGSGYSVGERPLVTIEGVTGAIAIAFGPAGDQTIVGQEDVTIVAGNDVSIGTVVRSNGGDVAIATVDGYLDLSEAGQLVHAITGSIVLTAQVGGAEVRHLTAGGDVTVNAQGNVAILGRVDTKAGDVAIASLGGNLDFTASGALIYAEGGSVALTAANGTILTPPTLNVAQDVSIKSLNTVALRNEITSESGDITVESISGSITTNANINAIAGSVTLDAHGAVTQLGRGINSIEVLTGGAGYNAATTVTIAAPVGGGVTATARPVIGANGAIIGIVIVNPGSGYGVNEQPAVTIAPAVGFPASGANALAHVTQGVIAIAAGENVTVDAGNGVTLINPVNAANGDVVIETTNGNVDASGANVVVGAQKGGVILDSVNGQILAPAVLNVAGDIALRTFGTLNVVNTLTSQGSITLESRNGAVAIGNDPDGANLVADRRVTLVARQGVSQGGGFIKAQELVVNNATTQPVTLANGSNDVENLSIRSLGAVAYTDANDFETGVNRTGVLGVEIEGDAVQLASLAPYSKVRVVSGMKYRTLSISAGANTPSTVGTVEFVTTSSSDNAAANAAFQGSLRDMIRYANDNAASYVINNSRKQQPQMMVFDEDGYAVSEIAVNAALPQFARTVSFDGGRLESTVTADRLGLRGNATAETGLAFGLGSSESRVATVAAYGFAAGSAIALFSGGNVVTDVYAGLMADGVTSVPNRVGIDVNGTAAIGNRIGDRVFDEAKVNRIVGNKASGIVIRNGASATNVSGNRIYNNLGDGVRITNAVGNLIGDPRAVHPDMTAADSNIISGNRSNGILVLNSNGGTYASANRIRNNRIEANQGVNVGVGEGAGIGIRGSKFTVIGGPTEGAGNTVVNQGPGGKVHGIAAVDSTDVRIIGVGNAIGVDLNTMTKAANSGDGINLLRSQRVEISDRNTIAGNAGNGIAIGAGSSAVTVLGNSIGLAATDASREDLGNALSGVAITEAVGNTVGAGNAIAFNGFHGVNVTNSRAATLAAGNRVFGSEIFANFKDGVRINGGSGTTVGGTKAGDANVIRGNLGSGIRLEQTAATGAAAGHMIQGNLIGAKSNREVDASMGNGEAGIRIVAGTSNTIAGGNVVMNNGGNGIELLGGTGNFVGGSTAAVGNTIANNSGSGIRIGGAAGAPTALATARAHIVGGNSIVENTGDGVVVDGAGVTGLTIGQQVTATKVSGVGNEISGNLGYGIRVNTGAQQLSFQGNSIADNVAGAVSIGAGANRSTAQTLALSTAVLRGTGNTQSVTVTGRLTNARYPQQQYSIDIYANLPDDGDYASLTGYQARRYLGRATVVTDSRGNATFSLRITAPLEVGEVITATATSLRFEAGSTSVLSNAVTADLPGIPTPRF